MYIKAWKTRQYFSMLFLKSVASSAMYNIVNAGLPASVQKISHESKRGTKTDRLRRWNALKTGCKVMKIMPSTEKE
jgi:hypothetical protein